MKKIIAEANGVILNYNNEYIEVKLNEDVRVQFPVDKIKGQFVGGSTVVYRIYEEDNVQFDEIVVVNNNVEPDDEISKIFEFLD